MRVLAIATKYKHHSKNGGYIHLSKYLPPVLLTGVDETKLKQPPYILRAYKWLYEWIIFFKYYNRFDGIHIYYVDTVPNYQSPPLGVSALYTERYYGVFPTSGSNVSFKAVRNTCRSRSARNCTYGVRGCARKLTSR